MLCVCTFQSRQISTNFIRSATVPYTMIIDTHCHLASAQFDQSRREITSSMPSGKALTA